MAYTGYDIVAFDRLAATTMADHIRKVTEAHLKKYVVPAQIVASGRATYNHGGRGFDWPVEYRRHNVSASTGANVRTYTPTNRWKQAYLPWRGYQTTDVISRAELNANRGEAAIIKVLDGFMDKLKKSLDQALARQFFNDGNANVDYWHGFESMFGTNGTVTATTGAQRATNAADLVAYPYDTYAGLSTELGNYGGAVIDGIWPAGDTDPQYEFWSPLMPFGDSTNAEHTSATDTWVGQCDEVLGFAITHAGKNGGPDAQPTTCIMDRSMFNGLKNKMRGKESLQVARTEKNVSLVVLGFANVIVVDGIECTAENSCPANVGYMYSYANMELRCQEDEMFGSDGPEYDIDTQSHKAAVFTHSNLLFGTPRNFVKIFKANSQIA